jgi:pilus assembly protein CpaB
LIVAVIAGVVAYITIARLQEPGAGDLDTGPTVPVVVAARAIPVRSQLVPEDLDVMEMPVRMVPETAVGEIETAAGQLTTVDLYPGEIIVARRLLDPNTIAPDGRLALMINDDQVLMAIPTADLMSQIGILKAGDHVDLLFTLPFPVGSAIGGIAGTTGEPEPMTFSLLQNVTIAAVVGGPSATGTGDSEGAPRALLLTLSPQDALVLKFVRDQGGIQDVVLRPPGVDEVYDVDPVDIEYMINRFRIPTEIGQ